MKTLLADTDYLVGYDADGNYIRISRADLAAQMSAGAAAPSITVQYSANGETWHDNYTSGDQFMRIKAGSGEWSGAIRICVSAYDIWLAQGNSGTEADFLESLRGDDGDTPDASSMQLQDIGGYAEFLQQIDNSVRNAQDAIVAAATAAAVENTLAKFTELQLEDIREVRNLSDDDFIAIVTPDGLRRVRIGNLSDNIAVRTVSANAIEKSVVSQYEILDITGAIDGENAEYTVSKAYFAGTSSLFLNGQRLVLGADYVEVPSGFVFTTYTPIVTDRLNFMAVATSVN